MQAISEIINNILKFSILLLIISFPFLILLFYGCVIVSLLTWLYANVTEQSYDFICDQSEILYKVNQVGKWTATITFLLVASVSILFFIYLLF